MYACVQELAAMLVTAREADATDSPNDGKSPALSTTSSNASSRDNSFMQRQRTKTAASPEAAVAATEAAEQTDELASALGGTVLAAVVDDVEVAVE